jgi:hypothetical protein
MRILTIGMGNLNRRRAIGAAGAAVRDESRLFVAGRAAEVHRRGHRRAEVGWWSVERC